MYKCINDIRCTFAHVCLCGNRSIVCKCKPHFILGQNVGFLWKRFKQNGFKQSGLVNN